MKTALMKRISPKSWAIPRYIWEVVILVTLTPALAHTLTSLECVPI
jgi:hypothetical protein